MRLRRLLRTPRVGVVAVLGGEPAAGRRLLDSVRAQRGVDVELVTVDSSAARREAVAGLRSRQVVVTTDRAQLTPDALRDLSAAGAPVIGGVAGTPESLPLLARMLVGRTQLLDVLRDDDDRDGVLPALRLLRDEHREIPGAVLSDVRPGEKRALWLDDPWADLDERLRVQGEGRELALDPEAFDRAWLLRDATVLVEANENATDEQWARFAQRLAPMDLGRLPVEQRAGLWLSAHRDRTTVELWIAERRFDRTVSTVVADGRVVADLDVLPPELRAMTEQETSLRALLTRLRRVGGEYEVEVFAGIRYVEQSDPAEVTASFEVGGRTYPVEVSADPAVTRWMGQRGQGHDAGRLTARVPAGVTGPLRVRLEVDGLTREARVDSVDRLGSAGRATVLDDGVHLDLPWDEHDSGVSDVVVSDDAVVVTLAGVTGSAALLCDDVLLHGDEVAPGRWRFALVVDRWGLGERPAPVGRYRLLVGNRDVAPTSSMLDRLPEEARTDRHRVTARVWGGSFVVRLDPPLADDEAGPRHQALLQASYARVTEPLDPGLVYVQSFTGQAVNDHPLAIQQELHRRRPDLDVRWLVADAHPAPPPGARAVQHRSREWYDVLARAGHVVTNIDLERWFRRREGQQVLQTYHGYPSKRMGLDQWRARGFPPSRIAQDLARSSGTWTALLTPQPDADVLYRESYAYDGRILALGYPRDDVLVGPDAAERRAEVRRRLAIRDRRAVLYAPTWRDDLATDFRRATTEHHLNPVALAERLGPDWVVVVRGHRFHAAGESAGRVLDATGYPDVNDLILAADAAVLDYSSLRFDFALTGRPAVYLVPDLDRYVGTVRGFYQDYATTAPGPLVSTTDEVADHLRAYDDLVADTRDRITEFNATFNALEDGHAAERVVEAFFGDLV